MRLQVNKCIICCLVLSESLMGCSYQIQDNELVGKFVANYGYGTSVLVLKADHSFRNSFLEKNKASTFSEGRWKLEKVEEGYSIGLDNALNIADEPQMRDDPKIRSFMLLDHKTINVKMKVIKSFNEIKLLSSPDFDHDYYKKS